MNGGTAEMRNQSRNELPLTRPMIPPASPKENAMITNAMAERRTRPPSEQRADRPDDGDQRDHDGDEPGDAGDDPDHDLEQEPRGERQDERGDDPHHERRGGGLLFHATYSTPPR